MKRREQEREDDAVSEIEALASFDAGEDRELARLVPGLEREWRDSREEEE